MKLDTTPSPGGRTGPNLAAGLVGLGAMALLLGFVFLMGWLGWKADKPARDFREDCHKQGRVMATDEEGNWRCLDRVK